MPKEPPVCYTSGLLFLRMTACAVILKTERIVTSKQKDFG